jgi:hypothetical protein
MPRARSDTWLLVVSSSSSADSSSWRVHVWRQLRAAGALYLQQGVALLPARARTRRTVDRLRRRASADDALLRVFEITIHGAERDEIKAAFCAERDDEYREICAAADAFVEELATERAKGRTTYTELEESEAELRRLDSWLEKVRERDYLDAPGAAPALARVRDCAEQLARFEHDAFEAEAGPTPDVDAKRFGTRLRAVE